VLTLNVCSIFGTCIKQGVVLELENRRVILMTPGPTEVSFRVLKAMLQPAFEPHDERFLKAFDGTLEMLAKIHQTEDYIILLPGTGRTGMEASAASLFMPGDKVLSVVSGFFGELWVKMMERIGIKIVRINFPWGKSLDIDVVKKAIKKNKGIKALTIPHCETSTGVVHPIRELGEIASNEDVLFLVDAVSTIGGIEMRMDNWHVDVCVSASQKCLGALLGLSIVALSKKSLETMEKREAPPTSFVYDLLRWKQKGWFQHQKPSPRSFPIYSNPNLVFTLNAACKIILKEGLKKRYERHRIARDAMIEGLDSIGLKLFPSRDVASNTVTVVKTKDGMSEKIKETMLRKHNILIQSSIIPDLIGKILRIGHLGLTASERYILPTISSLEQTLNALNLNVKIGTGVKAARDIFDQN